MKIAGASISYKYRKTSDGLWLVLLGIPLLAAYGLGLILIIIGAIRMKGTGHAKKIRKANQQAYGKVAFKIKENNERVTLLTKKRVTFYYKLENGLLGRTTESISKKTYLAIKEADEIIPIVVLGNRAVIDYQRLGKPVSEADEQALDFSNQEPAYRYRYGEMTKRSIVYLSIAAFFVLIIVGFSIAAPIYVNWYNSGGSENDPYGIYILTFFSTYYSVTASALSLFFLFYFLGMRKISFYGLAKKIRKEGTKRENEGILIPQINKKSGIPMKVLPNKAIFYYTAENGLLIQSTQVINDKLFKKIMEDEDDRVSIVELNGYAVIDNKETLEKQDTVIDKIFGFTKKYHIFFWLALLSNIYFFVTELIVSINSNFKDGISLFALMMYLLTIIYISVMELMDVLKKDGQWAYLPTVIYLSFNIIATVSTLVLGFSDSGVQFVHTTFNSFLGVGFIYFFYIIAKFSKSIINSKKAKRLDLDYERCQDFGDIVSNTSTLVNYIVWLIYVQFLLTVEARPLAIDIGLFSLIIGVNTILSIIFIFKCVNGMTKKKAMHKEDKQEI